MRDHPKLKRLCRRIVLAVVILIVAFGAWRLRAYYAGAEQLRGTWVAVETAFAGVRQMDGASGMWLTFKPDEKVTWHFETPRGIKAFDGVYHVDTSTIPKCIDLWEPAFGRLGGHGKGIYRIEGKTLIIHMGARRPLNFTDDVLARLVFTRKGSTE